ncbi:MAG: transcriptional regulator [Acidobacteria bacterium]|nr:transcriptional regulator [Acidobacteriota bacterium]
MNQRPLPEIDTVVHAPARLKIIAALSVLEEADFLYLLHATELTKGNLSTHLAKLEEAGYVEIEKTYRGKRPLTLCRLTPAGREAFELYRRRMLDFLGSKPAG